MKPNNKYKNLDAEFWANIKFLNQRLGYFERKTLVNPNPEFVVPTIDQIIEVFEKENLDYSRLIQHDNSFTEYGILLHDYFQYRKKVLNQEVEPNLMDAKEAKVIFNKYKTKLKPTCPLPLNKQKGNKKDFAFLTGLVNMFIEATSKGFTCNYDPKELTAVTQNGFPVRTLSRRVDGAFPDVINPIAIWEIKEYYYTTTFGSRVADGVYETMLDGYEIGEIKDNLNIDIKHYLFIDAHYTWWGMGKSYLCRIVDMLHMGLVDEVVVGKETLTRVPELINEWMTLLKK